jgi:hypothetical protein
MRDLRVGTRPFDGCGLTASQLDGMTRTLEPATLKAFVQRMPGLPRVCRRRLEPGAGDEIAGLRHFFEHHVTHRSLSSFL